MLWENSSAIVAVVVVLARSFLDELSKTSSMLIISNNKMTFGAFICTKVVSHPYWFDECCALAFSVYSYKIMQFFNFEFSPKAVP